MHESVFITDAKKRSLSRAAIGAATILIAGVFLAPERCWSNLFIATFYLLTIALGGTLFLALTFVTGAGWHTAFRRVSEALALMVPFMSASILVVLALRTRQYGWHHHGTAGAGTFWFKELWLTPSFWFARSIAYTVIWSILGGWIVQHSRRQDADTAAGKHLAGSVRLSSAFLVVYAVTFPLASVDWIMALEPMWFSTMWGVYNFSGMILAVIAVIVILCIQLSKHGGPLHEAFNAEHLHDLGKLLLGFSCFWMYIWFSQYMLIWYANIPEETTYFVARTHGPWGPVVVVSIILNWLVPFFVLLPRPAKRSRSVMLKVAVVLLLGRWVDLYLMVFPATVGATPVFGLLEIATIVCGMATLIYLASRLFQSANPVPLNDAYMSKSLNYHA